MARAAILIGVNRTGGLPLLSDAANGARLMQAWALKQGMAERHVHLFTDETEPVEAHNIRKVIRTLVDSGTIEQLIIYFAGHGVNIRYGEYWLLSGAPVDASAAINVEGCVVLARRCGIKHVVFISDACRTAAEGIQAQGINGSDIFPNDPVGGPEQAVDIFFATTLGRPALEVKDPKESSAAFKAVYTTALLDAVSGKMSAAMASTTTAEGAQNLVRPRLVKACLAANVPTLLSGFGFAPSVSQIPDARITSGDDAWLARFMIANPIDVTMPAPAPSSANPDGMHSRPGQKSRHSGDAMARSGPLTPQEQAGELIGDLLRSASRTSTASRPRGEMAHKSRDGWNDPFSEFDDVPDATGILVAGTEIVACSALDGEIALSPKRRSATVAMAGPALDVLITFADGSAALLPVLKGYVTAVRMSAGELVDVVYMCSPGSSAATCNLRSAVASAAREGIFRLDEDNAKLLSAHMKQPAPIDPTLALYAAYAFHDQNMCEQLVHLERALQEQLSISFFDIEILCAGLPNRSTMPREFHPVLPVLARGWSLLAASKLSIPDSLIGMEHELLPSHWTHFTAAGADRLQKYLSTRRPK